VDHLVEALLAENCGVQLVHVPEETTWEDHGFVRVKTSDGRTLGESNNYQHNRVIRTCQERTADLMAKLKEAGLGALTEKAAGVEVEGKATEPLPSDSEGSTKAASED